MESSQVLGGPEECISSNESGWTLYLASPSPSHSLKDDSGDDEEGGCEIKRRGKHNNDDNKKNRRKDSHEAADSDDSMASDASSGPSYPDLHCCLKHEENNKGSKLSLKKTLHQQRVGRRTKREKEESFPGASSSTSGIHGGAKVWEN